MARIEDGPTQFGDDWPGVFLRGDTAVPFGGYLDIALKALEKEHPIDALGTANEDETALLMSMMVLRGHVDLLKSCDEHQKPTVLKLKPYKECVL